VTGWLVTGAEGMLGRDLVAVLLRRGERVTGLGRPELDVTDAAAIRGTLRELRPAVVVNCAAWTDVDLAETREEQALRVNGHGAATVASACAAAGTRMVQVSTDYVFSGTAPGGRPYAEYDPPAPSTAYGRTKLAGERAVREWLPDAGYVVRTAWLYGAYGRNFVRTMIELERRRSRIQVVDDQQGQPTWTIAVADRIAGLLAARAPAGVYHATSAGQATWCELAREVFSLLGTDPGRVEAVSSHMVSRPARRPRYSVLGHDGWARAGLAPPACWRAELHRAFPALLAAVAEPSG
jgi:dTDP-4-dehydrorhamnose reductase